MSQSAHMHVTWSILHCGCVTAAGHRELLYLAQPEASRAGHSSSLSPGKDGLQPSTQIGRPLHVSHEDL